MSLSKQGFATRAIRAGQDPSQWNYGSVVTPLVMSTTFQQDAPAQHRVNIDEFSKTIPTFGCNCVENVVDIIFRDMSTVEVGTRQGLLWKHVSRL